MFQPSFWPEPPKRPPRRRPPPEGLDAQAAQSPAAPPVPVKVYRFRVVAPFGVVPTSWHVRFALSGRGDQDRPIWQAVHRLRRRGYRHVSAEYRHGGETLPGRCPQVPGPSGGVQVSC